MRKRKRKFHTIPFILFMIVVIAIYTNGEKIYDVLFNDLWNEYQNIYTEVDTDDMELEQPEMDVQLLTINEYSRPGTQSGNIQNIVIHYVANPGTSAQQNRDYFEGLKDSGETQASSHFIIGLEGEIIQCVPTWELAYASNDANMTSVSIECCHPDWSGEFTDETYESLVELTAWLCEKFGLDEEDVIRHYDITGKACPIYFVENEDAWYAFREDVKEALE